MNERTDGRLKLPPRVDAAPLLQLLIIFLPAYALRIAAGPLRTNVFELLVVLALLLARPKLQLPEGGLRLPSMLFLAGAVLGAIVAPNHIEALGILKGWFAVPALCAALALSVPEERRLGSASPAFLIGAAAVGAFASAQHLGSAGLLPFQPAALAAEYLPGRAIGPYGSPNFLAMALVPALLLSLPAVLRDRRYSILLVPVLAGIAASGSRGALAALAAAAFAAAAAVLRRPWILFGAAAVCAFASGAAYASARGGDAVRREIYGYAGRLVQESPVIGIGLGAFQERVRGLSLPDEGFTKFGLPYALHPHNVYLAVWLGLGLPGLAAFLLLIGRGFSRALAVPGRTAAASLAGALAAVAAHGFVDTTYFKNDLAATFWILLALIPPAGAMAAERLRSR